MKKVILALIMTFVLIFCVGCNSSKKAQNDCCNKETAKQDCCEDKEETSGNTEEAIKDVPDCCKAD